MTIQIDTKKSLAALILGVSLSGCGGGGFAPVDNLKATSLVGGTNTQINQSASENTMEVRVGDCGYVNEPCVSVTICSPGTTTCQTISNILLDTGSFGLRLFSSLVTVSLPTTPSGTGRSLAECVGYLDGTSQWGPVKLADVVLGGEKASSVPVQIIDANYASAPSDCSSPENDPAAAGYNGVLGVGHLGEDCGADCTTIANNRIYFSCSGTECTATTVALASQVANPVMRLPQDNNGFILQLPAVTSAGAVTVAGTMTLGIGTRSNNMPTGVSLFPSDEHGYLQTQFNGKTYATSFIDSGSNGLFFPATSALPECSTSGIASRFFCPTSLISLSATILGSGAQSPTPIAFQVMNAESALSSSNPNYVFNNLSGSLTSYFDWGLPFFLGRRVLIGMTGRSSSLGTGPYYAF